MTDFIHPDWPVPPGVRALVTTRRGGVSAGAWASLNLGDHVGDDPVAVAANRRLLGAQLPGQPLWLKQVHGVRCVDLGQVAPDVAVPEADASISRTHGQVCAVLTADCLPVLLCDSRASVVGIAHAGWRGLAAGVIEATVQAMRAGSADDRSDSDQSGSELLAWLGPAIGAAAFEVGDEVRAAFLAAADQAALAATERAFSRKPNGRWTCDLHALARLRLVGLGVNRIHGIHACTASEPERFFSFRRDGVSGRMASCIWLEQP